MRVSLIGMGCSGEELLPEARHALASADVIVGSSRLLEALAPQEAELIVASRAHEIASALKEKAASEAAVVVSGDIGFFSAATQLAELLEQDKHELCMIPGISSVQYFAARLGRPWQEWSLRSSHGRSCEIVSELLIGKPLFLLTSGSKSVNSACQQLVLAGLGSCHVSVGERLGYPDEQITSGTAEELASRSYDKLNVMLIELPAELVPARRAPGIPDDEFIRGKVPMSKQELRACILAKLAVSSEDVCWDIGAGTGAVSVELAHASRLSFAVERSPEACELIRLNREKHCAWNLSLIAGEAPQALAGLPAPDAVFVGGSAGKLEEILDAAQAANPCVRLCVSAIALETLERALSWMEARGIEAEVTQVAISRTRTTHKLHMLMANNPVFLVSGACNGSRS